MKSEYLLIADQMVVAANSISQYAKIVIIKIINWNKLKLVLSLYHVDFSSQVEFNGKLLMKFRGNSGIINSRTDG